jgi:hypothetical protein
VLLIWTYVYTQAEKQQKSHSGSPAREEGQGGEGGVEEQEEELATDAEK